jgi:hypothetical protein
MPTTYLNIVVLSAIALLACSFSSSPVSALSIDTGLQARHAHIGQVLAKRQTKRCKARTPSPAAGSPLSSSHTPTPTPVVQKANTPSTTPPAAPTPPPASAGNAKACLAFSGTDNVRTILSNFKTSHVSMVYNWSPYKVPYAEELGYEYAPMFWGDKDINAWNMVVGGYARYALGPNEPDLPAQSYQSPSAAALSWNQHMAPLRQKGYTLVSPATTSGSGGMAWMEQFLAACGPNCVDKIAVHWYGTDPQQFIIYLKNWYAKFGKPIWVTEVACTDFSGANLRCNNVLAFAGTIRDFMDKTWWVERYCPFAIGGMNNVDPINQLVGWDLHPTELAKVYFY